MYNYGESTIKVIDDYIDNEIDYDSAAQKLDGIVSSIGRIMNIYLTDVSKANLPQCVRRFLLK